MSFGYLGEKTRLVPVEREKHLANAYRWINDPEITENLLAGMMPITWEAELAWFERMTSDKNQVVFAIETLEGRHIGMSGVHNIDFAHGTCTTGSFIGEAELWGQGYGKDQALVRAKYIFEVLGMRLAMTSYLSENHRSKRMSESLGFVEYGFIPNRYWKNGRWRGEHLLLLTKDRFVEVQSQKVARPI